MTHPILRSRRGNSLVIGSGWRVGLPVTMGLGEMLWKIGGAPRPRRKVYNFTAIGADLPTMLQR